MDREVMERFLRKFKKENTLISYRGALNTFYEYLIEEKKINFDTDTKMFEEKAMTVDHVEDYYYYLEEKKDYKKSTANQKIEVVKEFMTYLDKKRVIDFNFGQILDKHSKEEVKNDSKEKYVPSKSEILRLIEATYEKKIDERTRDYLNARNRFYIALLSTTGLRANECLGIKTHDIEAVDGGYMVNIHKSRVKNSIDKRVPIPQSIIRYFEEYKIQRMITNEKFNSDLLFFSSKGNLMDDGNMNVELKRLCDLANIQGKITNHCFRHFLTQYLDSNGVSVSMIYKILGWKEDGIKNVYDGNPADKKHDKEKLRVCDVFR